jgi:DNA-directed RNA polymerase specialized sigma24 family protein
MAQTTSEDLRGGRGGFPPTRWSVVLTAVQSGSPNAGQALAKLCEAYWYPVYVFLRRHDYPPQDAEDLTQEFFARLVHKELLASLTQEGGRFRSFLLTLLKRFAANEWKHEHTQRRGGGQAMIPIDATAEARFQDDLVDHATPETLFEQQWAWTVLDRVLARLRDEYASLGKQELFASLHGCLPGTEEGLSYAQASAALHQPDSTLYTAALRLRRRYGELLRTEIADTVTSPAEVEEEIRHLMAVVAQS